MVIGDGEDERKKVRQTDRETEEDRHRQRETERKRERIKSILLDPIKTLDRHGRL